jgi:hypothetical protein
MSQDPPRGWEPPSPQPGPGGQPPPPSYGAQPPPSYGAQPPPQWGYAQPPPQWGYGQPPPQWGYGQLPPTPKPGVVPLRPLGLGEILDGAVQTIRLNPKVMLGLSAVVNLAFTVIVVLVELGNLRATFGGFNSLNSSSDTTAADVGQLIASLVGSVLQFVGTTVLTGLLVIAVGDAVLGKRPSIGEVWSRSRGQIWALLGVTFLVLLCTFGVLAAGILPGVLIAFAGSVTGGVVLAVFGGLAAIAVAIWVTISLLFAPPTVMLERLGVIASMRRSWRLVRGSWWRCLGIWLLAQVIAVVLSGVLQVPLLILGAIISSGTGSDGPVIVLYILGSVVGRTLVAPFSAAILALLYIDLRMRREGLDVRLQQAAAA